MRQPRVLVAAALESTAEALETQPMLKHNVQNKGQFHKLQGSSPAASVQKSKLQHKTYKQPENCTDCCVSRLPVILMQTVPQYYRGQDN